MTRNIICNNSPERTLSFPNGLFHGKEATLRISDDSQWVSVFDVIKMVGEQINPKQAWNNVKNEYPEVVQFLDYLKFKGSGQRETPCVNAKGLVLLLMQIPGEKAKQFRLAGADILVRYLGGDTTLIGEIEAINETHMLNPNNQASFFRNSETVQNNINSVHFTRDQLNNSKKLLTRFGGETSILYNILFVYNGILYMKFGIVYIRLFDTRYMDHVTTFGDGDINGICIYSAMKCNDVSKIESEFKKTMFYKMNKTDLTINGINYTEIIELTDNVTAETIKEEIIKVAGDRIIDPPPRYNEITDNSFEIEQERTKQLELKLLIESKKSEHELKIELKKFEFENMLKLKQVEHHKNIEIEKVKSNSLLELKKLDLEKTRMQYEMKKMEHELELKKQERRKKKEDEELKRIEQEKSLVNNYIFEFCKKHIKMSNAHRGEKWIYGKILKIIVLQIT